MYYKLFIFVYYSQLSWTHFTLTTEILLKIWRWTESTPRSGWWCSHMAGICSDCSTRKVVMNCWMVATNFLDILFAWNVHHIVRLFDRFHQVVSPAWQSGRHCRWMLCVYKNCDTRGRTLQAPRPVWETQNRLSRAEVVCPCVPSVRHCCINRRVIYCVVDIYTVSDIRRRDSELQPPARCCLVV